MISSRRNASLVAQVANLPSAAFTLIELMVVLTLIAILSAMILPEMTGTMSDAVLRSAGRKLVDVCNLANSRAVTRNEMHRVRLDRVRGRYAIESKTGSTYAVVRDVPGCEGPLDRRVVIELRREVENSETPEAIEAPASDDTIQFYPDGTADSAEILLRDRDGFQLALRVNSITARIESLPPQRR